MVDIMSIHGTNSHPYLNTPSNGSEEDFEFRMWLEEKQKVLPTELLSGLNSAVGTMARATIQQVDAQQTACITPNPVPSVREIMEQMQRDMQEKYKSTTPQDAGEHTGGSVSYYSVNVTRPTSGGEAYTAECNDIIEALGMNFAEGNVLKALWRICALRKGKKKRGADPVYDAEKIVFFGERVLDQQKEQA